MDMTLGLTHLGFREMRTVGNESQRKQEQRLSAEEPLEEDSRPQEQETEVESDRVGRRKSCASTRQVQFLGKVTAW